MHNLILSHVTRLPIEEYLKSKGIDFKRDPNTKALSFLNYLLRQTEENGVELLKDGKSVLSGDPTEKSIADEINNAIASKGKHCATDGCSNLVADGSIYCSTCQQKNNTNVGNLAKAIAAYDIYRSGDD